MNPHRLLAFILACSLALSACGTRDYDEAESKPQSPTEGKTPGPSPHPQTGAPTTQVRLSPKDGEEGYLWRGLRWIEVPDESVDAVKCALQDTPQVDHFQVWGSTLIAGAILGVIIRASGSWFLGKPPDPGPGHWFWNRLDFSLRTTGYGIGRGAAFAGFCTVLLGGASLSPIDGIFGQNFSALSSATAVGGLSSIAAAKPVSEWLEALFERGPKRIDRSRGTLHNAAVHLNRWSKRSDIGKGLRYQIAPRLVIFGTGFGVGLLIYEHLQAGSGRGGANPDVDPVCGQQTERGLRPEESRE